MLKTPLGLLHVYKNDKEIEYNVNELPLKPIEVSTYEVDARYLIEIDKYKILPQDVITFIIDTDIKCGKDGGDCLVEAMFESDDLFLALGGYDVNNKNKEHNFGYSFAVTENGLKANIMDLQYIEDFAVAIAWSSTDKEDFYTSVWFSADPYI